MFCGQAKKCIHCKNALLFLVVCVLRECVYTTSPAGSPQPLPQTDLWKARAGALGAAPATSSSACDSDLRENELSDKTAPFATEAFNKLIIDTMLMLATMTT